MTLEAASRERRLPTEHADAVVIGAGPAGAAAATFLAQAGHDVLLLEKERFPRDKVCGDGLTPRAVAGLHRLGLHEEAEGRLPGWVRQRGLRMYGGGRVLDLPWPELDDWPGYSLTATRALLDATLARHAVKAGARLGERAEVTEPVFLSASQGRVAGVRYRRDLGDGEVGTGVARAPVVLAADGGSSRFAVQLGLHRDTTRPMGVAVRAYYRSPRASTQMMEGFLELWRGDELLPGYGWVFPLDDGLVNVGWGLLNTSEHFRNINYRRTLEQWVSSLPGEWEISKDTIQSRPRSAGLPMGHNRKPPAYKGALLVGDAGGMINPFNGEGISYAIEAGELAAEAADAALRARRDAPLDGYGRALSNAWGGYFRLGSVFVDLIGHPAVMRFCTVHGMRRPTLMRFVFRLMTQLVNHRSRDITDHVVNALSRVAPAV